MKKHLLSKAGIFNQRVFLTLTLCLVATLLATFSFAGPKVSTGGTHAKTAVATPDAFGGPDPTVPGNPRYHVFAAPPGSSAESGSGEINVGFNPFSKHIFAMNRGPIWRLTTPELLTPAKPECCEALWEDKSAASLNTGLDPILWTDQKTGRTFASNSTAGANVVYGYTDTAAPFNDGDTWVQVSIAPPNGGVDHETIGSGPFPSSLSALTTPVNQGEYVLYCSQDAVGSQCQRSVDLGASYGPAVISTGPGTMSSKSCGGLHGHVKVAPDGTAWLPDKSCGNLHGGALSLDAGTTPWTEFTVPNSTAFSSGDDTDPSIAFDANNIIYYCYVKSEAGGNEGHMHVAVGKRNGASSNINWLRDVDVGASQGIVNAVFPQAVAGSAGRAACGFIGTNVAGSFQGTEFNGNWYPFIATTYDEGRTWVTVNATPNDPVQRQKGVCLQGIDCGADTSPRNLLDFNEITMDDKGRVLFGYDDGCVTPACIAGTKGNDGTAYMRIARQGGGKTLLAQFDPVEPALPKPACLSGTRDCFGTHLTWKAPDNGGSDITGYVILRGTSSGGETILVANTGNTNTSFDDPVDPSVRHYFYLVKAINGIGTSVQSNEIDLSSELLAADDAATTTENQPVTINVLENDCGLPPLSVTAVSAANHGAAVINPDSTLTYTPASGYFGPDSFTYTVRNAPGATLTRRVDVTVNPLCALINNGSFTDLFESGAPGWTVDTAANTVPASHTWAVLPDALAHSLANSFQSDTATLELKDDRLVAPAQNLSSTSHLIFWHRFQTEDGYDGGVVEVSTDGGTTWTDVIAAGGSFVSGAYNGTISPSFGSPIAGRPAWTGGDATADMTKVEINVGAMAGYQVRFRFRLACDPVAAGSLPGVAWFIDDVQFTNTLVEGACPSVVSRKTHGGAVNFDLNLPQTGASAIECRSGGVSNAFTLIYTLSGNVSSPGTATVKQGTATVGTLTANANQVTVPLSGVTNAQHVIVTLNGVGVAGSLVDNLVGRVDILVGDANADRFVDSADITLTKSQSGKPVGSMNFREDYNTDGFIDSGDITFVKSKSGTALP